MDVNSGLTVRLLDKDGNFLEMISHRTAAPLLQYDGAELVWQTEPTIRLKMNFDDKEIKKFLNTDNRWQLLLSRRRVLYGNITVLSPDGHHMFNCGPVKAVWYLNRKLAEVVEPGVIRLTFIPNGLGYKDDSFYLAPKNNCCVVCGITTALTRHHVVPFSYRRNMPKIFKAWANHDIVGLCTACHVKCERDSFALKIIIAKEYDVPLHIGGKRIVVTAETAALVEAIKSAAALCRNKKIPAARQAVLRDKVAEFLGHRPTDEDIVKVSKLGWNRDQFFEESPVHGELIIKKLTTRDLMQKFVERWRQHFIDTMHPQFMPPHWDVHRPIVRPEDE